MTIQRTAKPSDFAQWGEAVPIRAALVAVEMPPEMARAEIDLTEALGKIRILQGELALHVDRTTVRRAVSPATPGELEASRKRIAELNSEIRAQQSTATAARSILARHQPTYAEDMKKAIDPLRRAAAQQAVVAIDMLKAALDQLRQSAAAVEKHGGRVTRLPLPPHIDGIREIATAIVAESAGSLD